MNKSFCKYFVLTIEFTSFPGNLATISPCACARSPRPPPAARHGTRRQDLLKCVFQLTAFVFNTCGCQTHSVRKPSSFQFYPSYWWTVSLEWTQLNLWPNLTSEFAPFLRSVFVFIVSLFDLKMWELVWPKTRPELADVAFGRRWYFFCSGFVWKFMNSETGMTSNDYPITSHCKQLGEITVSQKVWSQHTECCLLHH